MLNPDYRDMLSAFTDAGVEYLVIGAYALAAHGHPRATGDLDLWVRPTPDNAERVMTALLAFGAPLTDVSHEDFETPGTVLQIGVSPRRIDILTTIEGVRFDDAWPGRVEIEVEDVPVSVIGREHFIQNKEALGRPQDRTDVERLRKDENG
ncbi:MAG: hypothetical protein BRD42_03580 [Bacteroidetes bacterium QS_3_64_15]|nr:MAG: hypothetical protein BRD42_03580 [Bacteroidetes bacterium QS_3_64_15]